MSKLQDFRRSYPQYDDLSDEQLLNGLHRRFYSDMPMDTFTQRMMAPSAGGPTQIAPTMPTGPAAAPRERGRFEGVVESVRGVSRPLGSLVEQAGDIGGSVISGAGSVATGVGGLGGMAGLGYDNLIARIGRGVSEFGESVMSPELRDKRQALTQAIKDAESEGFMAEAGAALKTLASNPSLLFSMTLEQIPAFVLSGGVGRAATLTGQVAARAGARGAATGAERLAAERTAREVGERAGTVGTVGTFAGVQAGGVSGETYQEVMGLPAATIERSPAYQELLQSMSPEEARQTIAERAAREAGVLSGGISVGTMTLMPSAERAMFTRGVSQGAIRRALGLGAAEAGSEAIEEGGGQFAQNLAIQRRADLERSLMQGVGGAAATGAALGGTTGAAIGALQRPPMQVAGESPELRGAIEQIVRERGVEAEPGVIVPPGTEVPAEVAAPAAEAPPAPPVVPAAAPTLVGQGNLFAQPVQPARPEEVAPPEAVVPEAAPATPVTPPEPAAPAAPAEVVPARVVPAEVAAAPAPPVEAPAEAAPQPRPDWRMGEPAGAAPEVPDVLPQNIKEIVDYMRKGRRAEPKGQVSLVQAIIKAGGLKDTGGEIKQTLGGTAKTRPGLLNRKGGLQLNEAAEYLTGRGYFVDFPTDNELLAAIEDEIAKRAVNYGKTADARGQQLAEAVRDLQREMDIAGVSPQNTDAEIARAIGIETPTQPRTFEDIEREDAARSAFSARSAEARAESPAAVAKVDRAQQKARNTVNKFLNDLRSRGRQARIFAGDLERLLKDRTMDAEQIYRGFMVADTLAKTIPSRADYRLKFEQDLIVKDEKAARASGAKVGDRAQGRVVYPEEGSAGLIELSLAKDMLPLLNETAAHEGFHILQTYFAEYDKAFADRINKSFKEDMKISDLEPSIKRRLQALKPPGSKVSYYDSLVDGLGDKPLSVKEAQSYAFGSLVDAANRGKPTTGLIPPFQRFVLFAKEFMAKLKSALNKDGFESATDLLLSAQRRGARMTQEAPTEGGSTYSARRVPEQYAARATGQVAGLAPFGQRTPPATPSATQRAELNVQYDVVSKALSKRFGRFIPPAKIESFFMKFQDKMLPVGRMIDEIRKAGGNVTVAMDAYLKEDLLQGKVATMLEKRTKDLYNPLVKALADSGLSIQDFENFLYARHAPERNKYVASINPDMPDGGSGLTDAEAAKMMLEFQQQGKTPKLTELAKMFDAIIADTNKLRVEAGLTPDFSVVKTTDDGRPLPDYKNYAPLRNAIEESADGSETTKEFRPKSGKALGARGREDRRVTGRERMAGDILAHAMMQNTQAVIRSEQNKVGQSFLALVRANPTQAAGYAEVIASAPLRTTIVNGVVKTMPDPFYKNDPDVLVVKENGKEVAIRIFDDNVARAMTGASALSPTSQGLLVQGMATVNRFLAKVNTAYNPEFLITNFARDLQTFGINIQQFDVDGLTKDVMGDLKGSMSGIRDVTRGTNNNPEMARYFERFRELGGTTDVYGAVDIEARVAEINEVMNKVGTDAKSWKDMAKAVQPVIKFLEDYNTVVENGIRTALFKNLVERGFNEEQAAQAAKNITVNFSKGGEQRVLMNALYLFYNASLQGSMAMMNAIGRSPRVRKIVAGVVVAGVLQDVINSMLSDVDDDEEKIYDKIPDHVLKRSFVLMDPFQITERGYFSFPMPYGFNAFFNMGREMSKVSRGATSPMKAAGSIVGTFVDSFNPIGGSESILNFVAPTVLDPVVDIRENRDFAGRPIVPERGGFGPQPPESQKYWNNTFAPYVGISNFLNEVTGGTRVIPGAVDISPNLIQYAVNYATGGVGKFVERSFNTVTGTIPDALRGDLSEVDVKGIPLFRSLYGNVTARSDTERYMGRMEEVLRVRQEIRDASQYGQSERVEAAMRRYPGQVEIMESFSRISRERAQISQRINEINRNPNIDADSKKEIIKLLRDQQNALVGVANQLYNQSVERRQ